MENRSYFGCKVVQREHADTTPFFVFYARTKDIKQWAGIRRVKDFPVGTQRILRETRKVAITRFLKSDPLNTIPNNILLAFEPGKTEFVSLADRMNECFPEAALVNGCDNQLTWGVLTFSFDPDLEEHLRPALIVDGQHRLYGMAEFEEDAPVLVVSLIEAPLQEQAFQFVVINNKAVKVPTENVKSIIAGLDEEKLTARLLKAGVRYGEKTPMLTDVNDMPASPFQNLLNWDYNRAGKKLVPLTAIEVAMRYLETLFNRYLNDDDDSKIGLFFALWNAVKANYPTLWGEDNQFMTKVNINALNEFLADRLKLAYEMDVVDIFDPKKVENKVLEILHSIPKEFWEGEWQVRIQDNANVRMMIKEDLNTLIENSKMKRPWSEDLVLVTNVD
jgi:DGQHR domain-containing protein